MLKSPDSPIKRADHAKNISRSYFKDNVFALRLYFKKPARKQKA